MERRRSEAEIVGQQLEAFINYDADDLVLCLSYPKEAREAVMQHFLVLPHTVAD